MIPSKKASKALVFMTLLLNVFAIGWYYPYHNDDDNNNNYSSAKALSHPITIQSPQGPIINDPKLKAEVVFRGLNFPTSMAFLGPNDILVLEKNDGTVRRVLNGVLLEEPLLNMNVANEGERGMLGIAIAEKGISNGEDDNDNNNNRITYVFLYYSESIDQDGDDDNNGENVRNRLYRY